MAIEEILTTKLSLKHTRAQLGLSQQKLADAAGVDRMTVNNCEAGKTILLPTAYKILNALNEERLRQRKPRLTLDQLDWTYRG